MEPQVEKILKAYAERTGKPYSHAYFEYKKHRETGTTFIPLEELNPIDEEIKSWVNKPGILLISSTAAAGKSTVANTLALYLNLNNILVYNIHPDTSAREGEGNESDINQFFYPATTNDYKQVLHDATKIKPPVVIIDEIRTTIPPEAFTLMQSGTLLIPVIHGNDIDETLTRFNQMLQPGDRNIAQKYLKGIINITHRPTRKIDIRLT